MYIARYNERDGVWDVIRRDREGFEQRIDRFMNQQNAIDMANIFNRDEAADQMADQENEAFDPEADPMVQPVNALPPKPKRAQKVLDPFAEPPIAKGKAAKVDWGVFTDIQQAHQHLFNRYVLYGDEMLLVSKLSADQETGLAICQQLGKSDYIKKAITDPKFNGFKYDPLGWMNADEGARLLALLPIRQTHRGYGDENIRGWGMQNRGWLDRPAGFDLRTTLKSDGFGEMIRGDYPKFREAAVECLNTPAIGMAIDRNYAVQSDEDNNSWLWSGADRVGYILSPQQIKLGRRFGYLREQIQECGLFEGVWLQ